MAGRKSRGPPRRYLFPTASAQSSQASFLFLYDYHAIAVMQPPEGPTVDLGKAQVIDRVPKVIKELKFGVLYGLPLV